MLKAVAPLLGFILHTALALAEEEFDFDSTLARAEQGDLQAIHGLCARYHFGVDLPEDWQQALIWCERSAKAGANSGQTLYAEIYYFGLGVERDYETALFWYRKAAEQGHPHATYMLYVIYAEGRGVPANPQLATQYLQQAFFLGSKQAIKKYNQID
ncbi:tetratricopeptide repeat protein [Halioxenophilus sp. WMMB6]|uniref:tetratricopeptide repeat protein n=1 Tax=Halioxenophilus sp. WMMB6 TaxID=3073815 RepID=UPI00295F4DC6|nr:tetratricopeptide repeat protein [Halioxenophilus sp. WMMB6]